MPNHFTLTFFCCEGAMYHVAIATVIFSHVKICFHAKTHLVFHWYLYNNFTYKTMKPQVEDFKLILIDLFKIIYSFSYLVQKNMMIRNSS